LYNWFGRDLGFSDAEIRSLRKRIELKRALAEIGRQQAKERVRQKRKLKKAA